MTIEAFRQLEDDMLGPEPDDYAEAVEPPADLAEADRTLRRVARIRRTRDAERETVAGEIARLTGWLEAREEHWGTAEQYHLDRLRRYHEAVLAGNPRSKTIVLPSGSLKARVQQPEWRFGPEFEEWAETMAPEILRHVPARSEIDRAAAKAYLTRTDAKGEPVAYGVSPDGEQPPGVEVAARDLKFDVELTEETT